MICVIFNPAARGQRARHFRRRLAELGPGVELRPTTGPGAATALAAEAVEDGYDTIVAAGGDGTVHETLNGLVQAPGGLERARLGILPLGTVNVFARELGLPLGLVDAWRTIQRGRERRVDLPEVEFGPTGRRQHRWVACIAGVGVDTRALALARPPLKKRWGWIAYVISAWQALRPPLPLVEAACAGAGPPARGPMVCVGNGRYYGGPFTFFPHSQVDDGQLGVTLVERLDWLGITRALPWLLAGRIDRAPNVRVWRGPRLEVTQAGGLEALVHADGEVLGPLPATFGLRPGALRVVAP